MYTDSQLEQNKRRFDIGSGVSLEFLDQKILDFIYNQYVINKLLGTFSGITVKENQIMWNKEFGVGIVGDSEEIVLLCCNISSKIDIHKILDEYGNIASILNTNVSTLKQEGSYEYTISVINNLISRIGPKIYLATVLSYVSIEEFINDHTSKAGSDKSPKRRLVSQITKGTSQNKILALSYPVGTQHNIGIPASHPLKAKASAIIKASANTYDDQLFGSARRAVDFHFDND